MTTRVQPDVVSVGPPVREQLVDARERAREMRHRPQRKIDHRADSAHTLIVVVVGQLATTPARAPS
jgi:hypothetical protein